MKDFTGWKQYSINGVPAGIQSPDGTQSRLLSDPDVAAWLAVPGNSAKLI